MSRLFGQSATKPKAKKKKAVPKTKAKTQRKR